MCPAVRATNYLPVIPGSSHCTWWHEETAPSTMTRDYCPVISTTNTTVHCDLATRGHAMQADNSSQEQATRTGLWT